MARTTSREESRICRIEQALGRDEPCPGASCALWDAVGGECVVDELHLDVGRAPELAAYLAELRAGLEGTA